MWSSPALLARCQELRELGLAPVFEAGRRLARGFADLGIEEFCLLSPNKIVSLFTGTVSDLPEDSLAYLENLDVWILDALRYARHPSHLSVEEALAWIKRINPKRAVLTHMHVDLDYAALARELPQGVEPGYDGMVLTTKDNIAVS